MGNDDDRLTLHQFCHCPLDHCFILRINVGGGLVQNHHGGVFQHSPGDGDTLPLSSGEMGASAAHPGVIAMLQLADKTVASGGFGDLFHFLISGIYPAHTDIFPDGIVKEVIVLRNKGHLVIELFQRDTAFLHAAQGNAALGHIPETGDELGNGGLARTGGTNQSGEAAGRNGEGDVVEDLLFLGISKGDMIQGNIRFSQLCRLCSVILLRLQENLVHRAYDGTYLGKIIHKAHGGNERSHNTHGQDDGGEKYLCGQTAVSVEDPAHRQHRDKGGGRDGIGQSHPKLAFLHPVVIVGGIGPYPGRELLIGVLSLIEGLDDLNAADVLHNGLVHSLGRLHRALIVLAIAAHNGHHKSHAHRNGHQTQQCHAPVQREQIHENAYRCQQIGGHLRQQVSQRRLHTLHLIYHDLFEPSAGGVQNISQW